MFGSKKHMVLLFLYLYLNSHLCFLYLKPDTLSPELCCIFCNGFISYMDMFIDLHTLFLLLEGIHVLSPCLVLKCVAPQLP